MVDDDVVVVLERIVIQETGRDPISANTINEQINEGVEAEVLVHDVDAKMEKHVAMSVVEKGIMQNHGSRSMELIVLSKQHSKENKGLRIKKGSGVCNPTPTTLSKWLPSVSNMIDVEARCIHHGLEQSHDAMDDDDSDRNHLEELTYMTRCMVLSPQREVEECGSYPLVKGV
ncbi:hypothetical protein V6N13_058878 [Hibiscus sabdariffa]